MDEAGGGAEVGVADVAAVVAGYENGIWDFAAESHLTSSFMFSVQIVWSFEK